MRLFRNLFGQSKHSPREVGLIISPSLQEFVKSEVLPGLDISPHYFWSSFENLVDKFIGRNNELLEKRNFFQNQINDWHIRNRNSEFNLDEYKKFLTAIKILCISGLISFKFGPTIALDPASESI